MSQLFNRVSRLIKAELNSDKGDFNLNGNSLSAGSILSIGGAVAGASIGKVGVLAGGTGYSVGAVPLAVAGALTGAALYEALRLVVESDASSLGVAALGATAGAATSAAIGGVGVSIGGTAIGVGMASMAATGAVVGLGIVGLNRLFQQGIEPEQLLDAAIEQMEEDVARLRQSLVGIITSQKLMQQQIHKAQAEVEKWKQRAYFALNKGNEDLAKAALTRKNLHLKTATGLEANLEQYAATIESSKQELVALQNKLAQAKAEKEILRARLDNLKLQNVSQQKLSLNSTSTMSAFERMENSVGEIENRSQATAELVSIDLEEQFKLMESSSALDEELEALKIQLLGNIIQETAQTSEASATETDIIMSLKPAEVNAELEELKRRIDAL